MTAPSRGVRLVADSTATAHAYELFTAEVGRATGPPAHVHRERDEAFYIVRGAIRLWRGDEMVEAPAGTFWMVPRGTAHRFEATEDSTRLLFLVSPPGLEAYFREMAELEAQGVTGLEARRRLAAHHDSHPVVGPPARRGGP